VTYTLTDTQVFEALTKLVEEDPGKVYKSPDEFGQCLYVHSDEEGKRVPGCIVGTVLNRLGVPLEELEKHEGNAAAAVIENAEIQGLSYDMVSLLRNVQRYQDSGCDWNLALDAAKRQSPALMRSLTHTLETV